MHAVAVGGVAVSLAIRLIKDGGALYKDAGMRHDAVHNKRGGRPSPRGLIYYRSRR